MVSGTKNTNTWRIATIAKSEMASPAHVARDTFVLTGDWLDVRPNGAPTLSVSIYCSNKMLGGAVWIQEYETVRRCFQGNSWRRSGWPWAIKEQRMPPACWIRKRGRSRYAIAR